MSLLKNLFSFKKKFFLSALLIVFLVLLKIKPVVPVIKEDIYSQKLNSLSQEEIKELKRLFHYLFAEKELGYTLLGDKPISFCFLPSGLPHIATKEHVFKIYTRGERSFKKGVAAWKKVKIKNYHENYSLIIHEENQFPVFAFLINKKSFIKEFNKNIDVFKKKFGPNVTAESFLKNLVEKKNFFSKLFHQHLILGILLGYGRHNAELFQRRHALFSTNFKIPFLLDQKPGVGFSSISEELKYLNQHLQPITKKNSVLLLVDYVHFAADPYYLDTHILKKKYNVVHTELTTTFQQNNWLDIILKQIEERN